MIDGGDPRGTSRPKAQHQLLEHTLPPLLQSDVDARSADRAVRQVVVGIVDIVAGIVDTAVVANGVIRQAAHDSS